MGRCIQLQGRLVGFGHFPVVCHPKRTLILLYYYFYSIAEDIPIYNYVSSVENPLTWGQFTDQNIRNGFDYPFSTAIWYISFHMHRTAFVNRIYMIFLHLLPALFIDLVAMCVGQRPRLLKMYKKIHKFSSVISFFCTNEWVSGTIAQSNSNWKTKNASDLIAVRNQISLRCLQTPMCNACGRKSAVEIRSCLILTFEMWIGKIIHIITSKECVSTYSKMTFQHLK